MTAEQWRRLETLYHLCSNERPEWRVSLLEAETRDEPEIRRELEKLLFAHDTGSGFIERPLLETAVLKMATSTFADAMPSLPGYELHGLLGRGGMGEVYRARDLQLDRLVAVKLLRPGDGRVPGSGVLVDEARNAARLNHPGICTIHQVAEAGGRAYVVMELVEGETVADRLRRGPIPPPTAVHIALQIVEAVAHAHRRGVMHGDLKNTNVMLMPDGTVKLLDFGLARRLAGSGAVDGAIDADAHGVWGTLSYMAPELLRHQPPDVRSDLWAIGVVLHEMLTGGLPFGGDTNAQMASAILGAPASDVPADVPSRLGAVVRRCLEKDRRERYQSATELHQDLLDARDAITRAAGSPGLVSSVPRRLSVTLAIVAIAIVLLVGAIAGGWWRDSTTARSAAVRHGRIAVMPLRIDDPQGEPHHSVALADVLAGELAALRGIAVSPTASVLSHTITSDDPIDMGRYLHADYVLTGSLDRSGDRHRLVLQLIDVNSHSHLWSDEYELALDDLATVGGSVAHDVGRVLGVSALQTSTRQGRRPAWPAFDAYLKGRALLARRSGDAMLAAVAAFEAALREDPDFAPAHAGLAYAAARLYWNTGRRTAEWRTRATASAQRALALNPSLAEAHEAIAAVLRYDESDWPVVIEESRKALALNPGLEFPHSHLAVAFYHLGLFDLSDAASTAAYAANPANRQEFAYNRGRSALYAGRFNEAREMLDEALMLRGSAPGWTEAEAYYYTDDRERSEAVLRSTMLGDRVVSRWRAAAALATFLAARGARNEARQVLEGLLTQTPTDHHAMYRIATAYAQLGDFANAQRWLATAVEHGFPCHAWFAADPLFEPARKTPEVREYLARLESLARAWRDQYAGGRSEMP